VGVDECSFVCSNPERVSLESTLQYLLSLLLDNELRHVAADAILTICQQCRKQLLDDLDQIIQATLWLDQTEAGSEAAQCLLKGHYSIGQETRAREN
jgi:hypothetical protein